MSANSSAITVDCGNSTICCRLPDGGSWSTPSRSPDLDGLRALFAGPSTADLPVLAVSVVPEALDAVRRQVPAARTFAVAGVDLPCPLRLDYETVGTLGADRWLGAFAARVRHGARAVVTVDCGSATTVNLVDDAGVFHGGAIAPGLGAMVAGMRATAPRLPEADLDAGAVAMPGRSTRASVDAGVLLGWAGAVERLVAAARAVVGAAAPVVVTGGHAARLLRHAREHTFEHVPDLLHDGLLALWRESSCS